MKKIILGYLLSILLCFNVHAKSVYDAEVSVDVTAENVVDAKKQAMDKAVRDGVNEVVLAISSQESVDEINKLTVNQLQHFVEGIMVLMEKSSDVRYIADLKITINKDVLKAYLVENDLPVVWGEEQEVLLIPIMEENGKSNLWGDDNILRNKLLERHSLKRGNLNINVIEKNLGNITLIEAKKFYTMNSAEYNELSQFNNIENIYVAKYSLDEKKIYVKSFPDLNVSEIVVQDQEMEQLIEEILKTFKDVKKEKIIEEEIIVEENMSVLYSYDNLGQWLKLKRVLEANPLVCSLKVISMGHGKVNFQCEFHGMLEKLQGQLSIDGYKLKKEGELYVIF